MISKSIVNDNGFACYVKIITSCYHYKFYRQLSCFFKGFQPGNPVYTIASAAVTVLLFFFFTSLYFDPAKILNFLKSKNTEPVFPNETTLEKLLDQKNTRFAGLSALYICVYLLLLIPAIHMAFIISGLAIIRFAAILLDLTDEARARKRHGYFVKIDELQKPYEAKFLKNLLEQNNIKCFLEGYYHRSLYYFFGPFIEISIYVEQDKKAEAMGIISEDFNNPGQNQ